MLPFENGGRGLLNLAGSSRMPTFHVVVAGAKLNEYPVRAYSNESMTPEETAARVIAGMLQGRINIGPVWDSLETARKDALIQSWGNALREGGESGPCWLGRRGAVHCGCVRNLRNGQGSGNSGRSPVVRIGQVVTVFVLRRSRFHPGSTVHPQPVDGVCFSRKDASGWAAINIVEK